MEVAKPEPQGMTLEEYKQHYTKPQRTKTIRLFLYLFAGTIGIVIFTCLLLVVLRVYEMNQIAGYVAIAPASLLFIFLYLIPLIKITKMGAFIVNVDGSNARSAQAHNKKVRHQIADGIIDFSLKTEGVGWYDDKRVGKLAMAKSAKDEETLKKTITEIFEKDVRPKANAITVGVGLKVGIYTALSQSETLDTAIVAMYGMSLIKDIIYLYGFRPSEAKLLRIYGAVIRNALIAYGASVSSAGIAQTVAGMVDKFGMLGGAIAAVIGSASQGVINGTLMAVLGYQTRRYLDEEYKLQNILDTIVVDEDDEVKIIEEVRNGVLNAKKKEKKAA